MCFLSFYYMYRCCKCNHYIFDHNYRNCTIMSYFCTCQFAGFIVMKKKIMNFKKFTILTYAASIVCLLIFLTDRPESLGLKTFQSFSLIIMTLCWRSCVQLAQYFQRNLNHQNIPLQKCAIQKLLSRQLIRVCWLQ